MHDAFGTIAAEKSLLVVPEIPATTPSSITWTPERVAELRRLWPICNGRILQVARIMGLTRGQVDGRSRLLNLQFQRVRRVKSVRRGSPADVEGRTLYPGQVRGPDRDVLKPGSDNRKLGKTITKGEWAGFPIFSLTLEERKTCPRSCGEWLSCYGSNMRWAVRYDRGLSLEIAIWKNLSRLNRRHPEGFAVRLHALGDFYSESYVDLWEAALDHFPGLRVWGYTHWGSSTPIGKKVEGLRDRMWDRFAVRTSGARVGPRTTVIARESLAQPGAIVCPVETGRATSCASCALCWSPAARQRPIAFVRH